MDLDIKTDDDLLAVLCDLRHGLNAEQPRSVLREDFTKTLVGFLKRWRLDEDQHSFAEWPSDPNAPANAIRDKPAMYPAGTNVEEHRAKVVDYIAASLRESLKQYVGKTERPSSVTIAETLARVVDRAVCVLSVDDDTVRVSMPVTPYELAQMTALRYSDGASHEAVTAWLEEATTGQFRGVLCEVESDYGAKMWTTRPLQIALTVSLGEPRD